VGHRVLAGLVGAGGGHGLAGMSERVARCGGTMNAGPTANRGWYVTASLPRHPHRGTIRPPLRSGTPDAW
jgi:hypothetical protein